MPAPQVHIYSGSFQRFAEVATASDIRRTYKLDNHGIARFTVDRDDAQVRHLDPRRGNIVVITSASYPWPWVGKVTTMRGDPVKGTVQLSCKSYDSILDERYLGTDATFNRTAGQAFLEALGQAGAINPHGIEAGAVDDTQRRFEGSLPLQSGRQALDTIAGVAGMEWWLEHQISGSRLTVRAHMAGARGTNRYATALLVHGAEPGPAIGSWSIDGEAAAFSATVVGGASSPIQAFNSRATAKATKAPADIGTIHGFPIERDGTGATMLTRREVLDFTESLRATGRVTDAAQAALARPGVQRRLQDVLVPLDASLWPSLGVGDVVRCEAPLAFLDGYSGPLRVLSAEVREEAGELALSGAILGGGDG